jgi:hypothetical protein
MLGVDNQPKRRVICDVLIVQELFVSVSGHQDKNAVAKHGFVERERDAFCSSLVAKESAVNANTENARYVWNL